MRYQLLPCEFRKGDVTHRVDSSLRSRFPARPAPQLNSNHTSRGFEIDDTARQAF
jgi:hypothetical protein